MDKIKLLLAADDVCGKDRVIALFAPVVSVGRVKTAVTHICTRTAAAHDDKIVITELFDFAAQIIEFCAYRFGASEILDKLP